MAAGFRPVHLVDCKTPDQVRDWLKAHCAEWHYGAVMAGCGLCELAQARLTVMGERAGDTPKPTPTGGGCG